MPKKLWIKPEITDLQEADRDGRLAEMLKNLGVPEDRLLRVMCQIGAVEELEGGKIINHQEAQMLRARVLRAVKVAIAATTPKL